VVLLIALADKNAILIVDLRASNGPAARASPRRGRAAAVAFRDLVTRRFILGVIPGDRARRRRRGPAAPGTAVSADAHVDLFGRAVRPVFYVVFQGLSEWRKQKPRDAVGSQRREDDHDPCEALIAGFASTCCFTRAAVAADAGGCRRVRLD